MYNAINQAILDSWSRSLKFGFKFSRHTVVCGVNELYSYCSDYYFSMDQIVWAGAAS